CGAWRRRVIVREAITNRPRDTARRKSSKGVTILAGMQESHKWLDTSHYRCCSRIPQTVANDKILRAMPGLLSADLFSVWFVDNPTEGSPIAMVTVNNAATAWVPSVGLSFSNLAYHTFTASPVIVNGQPGS